MATILQKRLAENIVKNTKRKKPLNKTELSVSVGYAPTTANDQQARLYESKGVQNELKNLGFSEEGAKQVVQSILHNPAEESSNRLRAASEVFKVMGSYAAEKSFNLTATASVDELKDAVLKDMQRFEGSTKPYNESSS